MIRFITSLVNPGKTKSSMIPFGTPDSLIHNPASLPMRRGQRPCTIRGPLHVQISDNADDSVLRQLLHEVIAWPDIEARPLPVGTAYLLSLNLAEEVATDDPCAFIAGREFGRALFGAPTIYLSLPLSYAHWAIVRGWAEPHFYGGFGLVPPGVMVIYTPRDENELSVCRSLFWISYRFSFHETRRNSDQSPASQVDVHMAA
jgi:hypothetical protein